MAWVQHEVWEGEAPGLAGKAAVPTPAEPVKMELPDTVKSMVAEAVSTAEAKYEATLAKLTARLETVEKAAIPGGPARSRTRESLRAAHRGDELQARLYNLKVSEATVDNGPMRSIYTAEILKIEKTLADLATATSDVS